MSPRGAVIYDNGDERVLALKARVEHLIREARDTWIGLSHAIHANPELAFEEVEAARLVAAELRARQFAVDMPAFGLDTAVSAHAGSGSLRVVFCAEYDALPQIGHACGHNIIAASSVASASALAELTDELDITVAVLGTPAEEGGAGKSIMLERGAFRGAHLALMTHPAAFDDATPMLIAGTQFTFEFRGKSSHAAAAPELGINAADAANLSQVALGLLRQQLPAGVRIHGIVTAAGDSPNTIPESSRGRYVVRASTRDDLESTRERVEACFRGAALSSGCDLDIQWDPRPYADVRHDAEIAAVYKANALRLGRTFHSRSETAGFMASTDLGVVSHVIPSIHPIMSICGPDVTNHQAEFAAASRSDAGDTAVIDAAICMAWTVIDVALCGEVRDRLMGLEELPAG